MQIIITILNNTNTSYIQKDNFDNDQYQNIYRCIIDCETLETMKQFISDIMSEILEQHEKQAQSKTNNKLIETIISYINENYHDCNLSINFLSDKFSISSSYLFKSIKEYTGESFTDLLIKIRMQHAEQLLRTTSMKIPTT